MFKTYLHLHYKSNLSPVLEKYDFATLWNALAMDMKNEDASSIPIDYDKLYLSQYSNNRKPFQPTPKQTTDG